MSAPRYEVRAATLADEAMLLELARYLDSVNLPHDRDAIRRILELSERSFAGDIKDPRHREYVFVLIDLATQRAVGTSLIVAQLGRRDAPYIYFDVRVEERYSATLDRHFAHEVLSIGYSYDGPTEIGGLVVHPEARRAPDKLGMIISYVRFLFMAMHREAFQRRVLAELLPPLEPDGTSHLWEAVGRHFTNLTYREADRLSKQNKEFIRGLFPDGDIYASLLSPQAQGVIGRVGPQTRGVEKLLRRIGFRYWNRVDPFDGGPHFVADMDEISLVQRVRRVAPTEGIARDRKGLIATDLPRAPYFRAVVAPLGLGPTGEPAVSNDATGALGIPAGVDVFVLPLD
ncbi:MAG: arginine N-succinyltransferase [Sandaracinaceae bacterium]|nr:arginine N-succinyltransferase [Sandaracinaceae bacterium]